MRNNVSIITRCQRRGKQKRRARKDVVNYQSPYMDSSGEKFYLP